MFKLPFRLPLLAIAAATAIAIAVAHATMPPDRVIMALYFILLMVSAALSFGYAEGVYEALKSRKPGMLALYTVGAFLPWLGLLGLCLTALMIRSGHGEWLRSTPVISAYLSVFILAGMAQMLSPGALDGRVPRSNWIKAGFWVGGGLVATILFIVLGL